MATQYTCSLNSVYCPLWLVQWSCHCSHMHIPVRSPWLPGHINVMQTILVILVMAGLFPDRPCVPSCCKWDSRKYLLGNLHFNEKGFVPSFCLWMKFWCHEPQQPSCISKERAKRKYKKSAWKEEWIRKMKEPALE